MLGGTMILVMVGVFVMTCRNNSKKTPKHQEEIEIKDSSTPQNHSPVRNNKAKDCTRKADW